MKAPRTGGIDIRANSTGGALPGRTLLGLYPEILKRLPTAVILLLLEDPSDAQTFRIVDVNQAAAAITRSSPRALLGKTFADFPGILETPVPGQLMAALQSGENRDLGEISYGESGEAKRVYSVRVFPLSQKFLGVAIEDIDDRIQSERTLRGSEERFRLLVEIGRAHV